MTSTAPNLINERITVDTKELKKALTYLKAIASERSLSWLSMKADEGVLTLTACTRILSAQVTLDCLGSLLPTAVALVPTYDAVRTMPGDTISFAQGQWISGALCISVASGGEDIPHRFPPVWHDRSTEMTVSSKDIKVWTRELLTVVTQDSPRNYGSVAYLGKDQIVGTDGFRLTYIDHTIPTELQGICIPHVALKALGKLTEASIWDVSEDRTIMRVRAGNTELICRLSAVNYPNYTGVLPTLGEYIDVPVCTTELKGLLTTSDKSKAITIDAGNGALTFRTPTSSFTLELSTYNTMTLRAINGKFLLDTIKGTKAPTFRLYFSQDIEGTVTVRLPSHSTVIVPIRRPQDEEQTA